jgi:hypothetical protein
MSHDARAHDGREQKRCSQPLRHGPLCKRRHQVGSDAFTVAPCMRPISFGIAAEFVRLKVDVIVTGGDAAAAARQATSVIPIVFVLGLDPLGSGLVASLARPGGNVTGLSIQGVELATAGNLSVQFLS